MIGVVDQPQSGEPAKKKVKATGKRGDTGRIVKQVGGQGEGQKPQPQKQQDILRTSDMSVFGENFAPFSGCMGKVILGLHRNTQLTSQKASIYCLVSSLRLLQFTREPNLVPKSITQTSQALSNFIQDFINGKPSTLIHSAHLTRGAATALTNERREVVSFSEAVENSCIKVLSALKPLADNLQEGDNVTGASNSEFIVAGIQAVIKTLVEILSSIYINTKALLSAAIYHTPTKSSGKSPIKDIRLELTTVLIRLLKGLNPAVDYQRNILEGTLYCLLEIIGGALSRTLTGPPTNNNVEAELLDALAVDETTWYLLRMVESILPVAGFQFGAGDRKLEGKSRERLRDVLIRGLFGSKSECEGVKGQGGRKRGSEEKGFWKSLEGSGLRGHGSTVESPFLRALWELFGLDVLAA